MNTHPRSIVHMDMDSFFVSVECLKNSSLIGKAIAVGGNSDRGVIASCSYEARKFGVRSAMPVRLAKRLCPQLLIIKGDMDLYLQKSKVVTEIIAEKVPVFEKSSIDEFYVDLTGMDKFFGCAQYSKNLKKTIANETGLAISYALASNKLISKVGTNEAKPNGQILIPFGNEKTFLAPLPIRKLPMIGTKTNELLQRMGVETISTLSKIPVEMMINLLGKNGIELWRRANGIDETPIIPFHEQKSIGTEHTFQKDTTDVAFLLTELTKMTDQLGFDLRQANKLTGSITIKIRYSDFQTYTRQAMIPYTSADNMLLSYAKEIFFKLYERRLLVRLIGIRFSNLIPGNYQINLFDDKNEVIKLYQAMDSIKYQFGSNILIRASALV